MNGLNGNSRVDSRDVGIFWLRLIHETADRLGRNASSAASKLNARSYARPSPPGGISSTLTLIVGAREMNKSESKINDTDRALDITSMALANASQRILIIDIIMSMSHAP